MPILPILLSVLIVFAPLQGSVESDVLKGEIHDSNGTSTLQVIQRKSRGLTLPARTTFGASPEILKQRIERNEQILRAMPVPQLPEVPQIAPVELPPVQTEFLPLPSGAAVQRPYDLLPLPAVPEGKSDDQITKQLDAVEETLKGRFVAPPTIKSPHTHPLLSKARAIQSADSLSWDEWYSGFAEIAKVPIAECVNSHGSPAGQNSVRITVWSDHRVKATMEKPGDPEFDAAIIEAYESLNGNAGLAFPVGSLRPRVTFLCDHHHFASDPVVEVTSHKLVGDKEQIPAER